MARHDGTAALARTSHDLLGVGTWVGEWRALKRSTVWCRSAVAIVAQGPRLPLFGLTPFLRIAHMLKRPPRPVAQDQVGGLGASGERDKENDLLFAARAVLPSFLAGLEMLGRLRLCQVFQAMLGAVHVNMLAA